MSDTILSLGPVNFQGFEIPESIPLGGAQQLVIHKLPGGARVVQAMGADDEPITWSGLFTDSTALDRARALDLLRQQGQVQKLTFFEFSYQVVIKSFKYVVERFYRVRYTLELEVIPANTVVAPAAESVGASILADSASAVTLGGLIGNGPLSTALATMNAALGAVSNFAQATSATINGLLAPVAAVTTQVNALISSVGSTLQGVTSLGGVLPSTPISQQALALTNQATAATQLPLLYNLQSITGRIGSNLGLITSPASAVQQVVAGGTTLFDVAAQAYGDASRWTAIAQANKLTDPQLTGIQTINIPPNPPDNGGVYTT